MSRNPSHDWEIILLFWCIVKLFQINIYHAYVFEFELLLLPLEK
jgi:hypothetical protein